MQKLLLSLSIFILLFPQFSQAKKDLPQWTELDKSQIDIVRDSFGVPHIFAPTDKQVVYGLAWTTCEDDFETLQWSILASKAMLGMHLGVDGAKIDYAVQLLRAREVVDEKYETDLSPEFRDMLGAYAQAVNQYALENPKKVLVKKAFPVEPKDMAVGFVLSMSLMSGIDKVLTSILDGTIVNEIPNDGVGSNAFAFNSKITKDGNTYLAVNSHQPLEGPLSWYEIHLCSEEGWNIIGGTFHGGPAVFHGTNEYLGWAHTVNYFDLTDVFKLRMHPEDDNKYFFDGKWLELEEEKAKLRVKIFPNFGLKIPVKKKIWNSVYGPTLKTDKGVYSIRLAGNMRLGAAEQWYRMNKAKNYSEFREALDMQQQSRMTIVYADKYDTIFALSNGLVPVRNPNYDWQKVLPGDTSATLWTEFHPVDDLPQLLNPDCGFLYNANNSAFHLSKSDCDLDPADYDPTMGYDLRLTNRGERIKELIKNYENVDWQDFMDIKYDLQYPGDTMIFHRPIDVGQILTLKPERYPNVADALRLIQSWNRSFDKENKAAALVTLTLLKMYKSSGKPMETIAEDKIANREWILENLEEAQEHLIKYFGRIDVPLGDWFKLERGGVEYPISGGPDVIRAAYPQEYGDAGKYRSWVGDSYIQMVKFTDDGPEILSVSPFGASNTEGSPHYTDQMPLYTGMKHKKMTFDKDEIYKAAESVYHPD